MSDETTTTTEEPEAAAVPAVPDEPAHPAVPAAPAEPITFRNKFLMPLIVPLLVTATIVFYVLNVSRVFLATGDAVAVGWATVITVAILAGGSALAASPRLRSSSLTLILGGAFLFLLMAGLVSIGAASPTKASGPVQCTPVKSTLKIGAGAGGALRFSPSQATEKAGCVQIDFTILNGSHTFQFDGGAAAQAFPLLDASQKSWAGVLPAGKYAFHCTIPGHATNGMVGVLTVTP